jgi:hypothetical protein
MVSCASREGATNEFCNLTYGDGLQIKEARPRSGRACSVLSNVLHVIEVLRHIQMVLEGRQGGHSQKPGERDGGE